MNKGSIVERLCSDLIAKSRDINGLLYFTLLFNVHSLVDTSLLDVVYQEKMNGEQQLNCDIAESENLRDTSSSQSLASAPKVLMVINKDGTKTIMTLVSGKNKSDSDSANNSLMADASNDSQDSNSGAQLHIF